MWCCCIVNERGEWGVRQTDRQTRQTRQTDKRERERDRQTDRWQTEREREREEGGEKESSFLLSCQFSKGCLLEMSEWMFGRLFSVY